jgi:hypothetical protein
MDEAARFFERGWVRFAHEAIVAGWAARALPVAEACLADPAHRARWLRCGATWFAGVNVLPNDGAGAVAAEDAPDGRRVPPLEGAPVAFAEQALGLSGVAWDAGQVSVCFPGYPQPWEGESEAAFRYRRDRDAAHVDGLLRFDGRRRRLGEVHGFILGLPLDDAPAEAAPLVVWEGSHEIMRQAFRDRFAGLPPGAWADEDITEAYVAARRAAFRRCRRVAVHARPGECYLVHRLALHGVAPWTAGGAAARRMIVYFRPDPFPGMAPAWWLDRP